MPGNKNKVIMRVTYHPHHKQLQTFHAHYDTVIPNYYGLTIVFIHCTDMEEKKKKHPETPSFNHWPTDQHQSTRDPQNSNNCYIF